MDEGTGSPSEAGAQNARSSATAASRVLRDNLTSVVLLAVALIGGGVALAIFPTDGPVTPTSQFLDLGVDAAFVPDKVNLALTDGPSIKGMLVTASVVKNGQRPTARAVMEVVVPRRTWGGAASCSPQAHCTPFGQGKIAEFKLPAWAGGSPIGPVPSSTESVRFTLPDIGYNTVANPVYVSAVLPNITFCYEGPTPGCRFEDVASSVLVRIPHSSSYTWTSGTEPQVSGAYTGWNFTKVVGSATVASGISLSAQDQDTRLIFIAGALLGIAGGAFVGAIQEGLRAKRRGVVPPE
jgi:hypothetical protein